LNGVVDELRIYQRALGPEELKSHPYGRISGKETSLAAYYRFDEGASDAALDHAQSSGVVHDGILGDGKTYTTVPQWVVSWAPFESCVLRCSDHGFCQVKEIDGLDTQVCKCNEGYDGEDCEIALCPGNPMPCSGHGACIQKRAGDIPGFVLPPPPTDDYKKEATDVVSAFRKAKLLTPALKKTVASSVDAIEREAKASFTAAADRLVWRCECIANYAGDGCEGRACPADCSGHGKCDDGVCQCLPGYRGLDCSALSCPNDCSSNGQCVNGTCVCDAGFGGIDCGSLDLCPNDCSGHGRCDKGECWCQPSYTGDDCSWASSCYNFCSGRGKCVNEACMCDPLFTGIDCSEPRCPRDCSGRGDCIEGICICEAGYEGSACEHELLWPMRCSTQRHGFESSLSCKRGLPALGERPPAGTQVLQVQFSPDERESGAFQFVSPA